MNLLMLNQGDNYRLRAADSRLKVDELSPKEVSPILRDYVFRFYRGADTPDKIKELWTWSHQAMAFGSRLFAISGSGRGITSVKATKGRESLNVDVAIVPATSFKVAFRLMRHTDAGGALKTPTTWRPDALQEMLAKVNAIYTPQVNIYFNLDSSEWINVKPELHQPIDDQVFRKYIAPHKSSTADVTVFLIGRWKGSGSHPNGTYFREEKAIAICDNPVHPHEIDTHPFALTLAHELAHFVQHTRGYGGHHDRENVLLSLGIQSSLIDKELLIQLNPW
jgi:hypothetical protein